MWGSVIQGISTDVQNNKDFLNSAWAMNEQQKQQGHMFDRTSGMQREAWARDDTAMQRRVADLKAAGLNPMLAISGIGASHPSSGVAAPPQGGHGMPQGRVPFSAATLLLDAQRRNIDADTQGKLASAAQATENAKFIAAQVPKITAEIRHLNTDSDLKAFQARIANLDSQKLQEVLPWLIREIKAGTAKKEFGVPSMEHMNQVQKEALSFLEWLGTQYVSPGVSKIGDFVKAFDEYQRSLEKR